MIIKINILMQPIIEIDSNTATLNYLRFDLRKMCLSEVATANEGSGS